MNTFTTPIPTAEINACVDAYIRSHSGHDPDRNHFGMSNIGMCPRALYYHWLNGQPAPTDAEYRNFFRGHLFESLLK